MTVKEVLSSMDNFLVTLPSNVSSHDYWHANTIGNYITKLAKKITLIGEWEVGLKEISYTKSWYILREPARIMLSNIAQGFEMRDKEYITRIDAGYYPDQETLVKYINESIKAWNIFDERPPEVMVDPVTKIVQLIPAFIEGANITLYPTFEGELANILGVKELFDKLNQTKTPAGRGYEGFEIINVITHKDVNNPIIHQTHNLPLGGSRPIDMSAGYHSLFVYCDLVEPSFVGDSLSRLLKVVEIPSKSGFGDQIMIKFDNPHYHSLLKKDFDRIEIDILDDAGERVPFRFGRSIVSLHFRKVA